LQDQLYDSIAKTSALAGVSVELVAFQVPETNEVVRVVWVTHNFGFLGGSLGCAEGEKLTRAFEHGLAHKLPVCVQVGYI
jgi:acetyl-CoA carboxylase beta subunit